MLVRAPNAQTNVGRLRKQVQADFGPISDAEWEDERDADEEPEREIAHAEGIALRSHLLAHGRVPPWNEMGGELDAWGESMNRPDHSGKVNTGAVDVLLQARRTTRELADDPTAMQFESVLHLARSDAVVRASLANEQLSDFQVIAALDALGNRQFFGADRDRIRESGYLTTRCRLVCDSSPKVLALREAWTNGTELPNWMSAPPLREEADRRRHESRFADAPSSGEEHMTVWTTVGRKRDRLT